MITLTEQKLAQLALELIMNCPSAGRFGDAYAAGVNDLAMQIRSLAKLE